MGATRDGKSRRFLWAIAVTVPLLIVGLWQTQAQAGSGDADAAASAGPVKTSQTAKQAAAGDDYWTAKRMREATPMDAGYVVDPDDLDAPSSSSAPPGPPGISPGWKGGKTAKAARKQANRTLATQIGEPQHGTKPTDPLNGPYGPFQRWSLIGKYTQYPARTVGKLFFTLNGGGFQCSASVIGTNKIITAGHCVSDGTSTFATAISFCPAFRAASPTSPFGCWDAWNQVATSGPWHFNGDPDYDYAVVTFFNDGNCVCPVGSAVGAMSYGWNWGTSQPDMSIGYPANAPFPGNRLIQTASTDWYTHDFVGGGQISKVMGNDMTGGSSGGPWVLGWSHPSAEVADTDGFSSTDPPGGVGFPFVNGVNSHKRCVTTCQSPPTTTNGIFWQEMTSPPFEDTGDINDVLAIINLI